MNSYKARALSRETIRRYVRKLKKIVGVEYELNFSVIGFIDIVLPQIIKDFELEILPREEMGNTHGLTYPSKRRICLREDVYMRAIQGEGRDRLTIAHEIGHLLLHDNEDVALCRLAPNEKLKAYEDPEWQADAFGGELLASSYLIKGMSEEEVQIKCGVTPTAARCQLRALRR